MAVSMTLAGESGYFVPADEYTLLNISYQAVLDGEYTQQVEDENRNLRNAIKAAEVAARALAYDLSNA